MISDAEITLNHRGFFLKPKEEEEAFLARIAVLQRHKTSFSPEGMREALALCEELFDARPSWVAIIEQQKGLSAWQGAVLWIQEEGGYHIPLVQLSPRLKTSWLKRWYKQEEVLAHELLHAMRLPLNASRFEEIIAYQTSRSRLRKWLGPVFQHPYEVYLLLFAVLLGWMGMFWEAVSLLIWTPWMLVLGGMGRLMYMHWNFKRAKVCLELLLKDKDKSLAVLARLTDDEISFFAKASLQESKAFVLKAQNAQLRWQLLTDIYFLNN